MKKKLKIEELKVQSFITELKPDIARTAKGGDDEMVNSTAPCYAVSVAATVAVWNVYTTISKANSLAPYNNSTECTKITSTTTTTTTRSLNNWA